MSTLSNSPALKCFTTNVRSLMNKLLDFNIFIDYYSPDVVALTETWLSDKSQIRYLQARILTRFIGVIDLSGMTVEFVCF